MPGLDDCKSRQDCAQGKINLDGNNTFILWVHVSHREGAIPAAPGLTVQPSCPSRGTLPAAHNMLYLGLEDQALWGHSLEREAESASLPKGTG